MYTAYGQSKPIVPISYGYGFSMSADIYGRKTRTEKQKNDNKKNEEFTHKLVHHNQVHVFKALVRGSEASFAEKRADRDIGELEVFLLQKGEGS